MRFAKTLPISIFLAAIAGCASDKVVLLPNADGSQSALILKTKAGEQVIDQPYEGVNVNQNGAISLNKESPESVRTRYGEALNAQPKRPASYTVYFLIGKDEITPQSLAVIDKVKADLKTRRAAEIVVIGHTDRVGNVKENDALSLKRANVMRNILLANGVTAEHIEIAGRGEREPLVPTDDEVPESKNRRVEISVR
jgi:outer membrane protein OmpA-like peptidoglycan-associated protein